MRITPTNMTSFKGVYTTVKPFRTYTQDCDLISACENTPNGQCKYIDTNYSFKLPNMVICDDEVGNHLAQYNEYMALANRGKQKVSRYDFYHGLAAQAKELSTVGFKTLFEKLGANLKDTVNLKRSVDELTPRLANIHVIHIK